MSRHRCEMGVVRSVIGLRWARTLEGKPSFISEGRPRGVKGEGVRYEKGLAKGLGARFRHGVWWEYKDAGGVGHCQTDFFGKAKDWIILLESKLTWTQDAEEQLYELYVPVVACALRVPKSQVIPIVVCKYLTRGADRPIGLSLKESIHAGMEISAPFCAVWHHLGGVPLIELVERSSTNSIKEVKYG